MSPEVELNGDIRTSRTAGLLLALCALAGSSVGLAQDCYVPPHLAAVRPGPLDEPTEVLVGAYLLDLRDVDDSKQSFEADVFYTLSWNDPRLVSDQVSGPLTGCTLPLDSVWNPLPELANERDLKRRFAETVTVDDSGQVLHIQRVQGRFTAPLDLREFPFDTQRLFIEIVARRHTPEEVRFVLNEAYTGMEETLTLTDWTIGETGADFTPRYLAPRNEYLTQVKMYFDVRRDLRYYILKIFLPLTLIICMSWAVFWMDPSMLPPLIGVSTSAVLTLIAFQFSLGYMLPRLAYLTRADRFLLGSTFLVFGAFGEALLTSYFANHGREARALRIDRFCRWFFPLMYGVVVLFSFVL